MDEFFIRDAIGELKAKENLLNAVTNLKIAWNRCQSTISDIRLENVNKYISENYPFDSSVEEVDIGSWCDSIIDKIQEENQISEEIKKQYQEISAAFERYIDMCSTKYESGDIPYDMLVYPCDMLIYPLLHLPSYKDNVAVVFHNVYDNCNLIAYLKDGALEIDNESGESIFDHNSLEKNGLTENEAYYIKYGKLPQGHDEHDLDDMEQDL